MSHMGPFTSDIRGGRSRDTAEIGVYQGLEAGRVEWRVLFLNWYRVLVCRDKTVLEIDSGDGYTTL